MANPKDKKREYVMTFAGELVKHLGLQMYSGPAPAIGELVSNAWDAVARNIWIEIPLNRPIEEKDSIVIKDDGHGMTYDECNKAYLIIGRDRRGQEGDFSRSYNSLKPRKLQSRKGIGKLAGFGIANRIEIRTVANGEISHFALDYDKITKGKKLIEPYAPESLPDDGRSTKEKPNTKITLSQLKLSRAIPEEQFRRSLARRFTILSSDFQVYINKKVIKKEEVEFEFRFPEQKGKWKVETLSNGQQIKWWAGFCKTPIQDEEARGFVVYARGKMAQTPWFFDLSGGVWGQHGLQYLTGEIIADFLDITDGQDLIATDRGTVRWEEILASPLKEWGVKKVKELLNQWVEKRQKQKIQSKKVKHYLELAQNLPERESHIFRSFVDKVCAIPQIDKDKEGKDILDELIEFGFNALTNRHFMEVIRQLNAAKPEDWQNLQKALEEWTIIEAIETARVVKGHLGIIDKFQQMIDAKVREKPDMQDFLCKYPWLIDPTWTMVEHEKRLDTVLEKHFLKNKKLTKSKDNKRRLDFFCLSDSSRIIVVEVKRPGENISKKELRQVMDYVDYLRKNEKGTSDLERPGRIVQGYLIAGGIDDDALPERERAHGDGVFMRTWDCLLKTAKEAHKSFYDVVKRRAPAGDPRIANLEELENED